MDTVSTVSEILKRKSPDVWGISPDASVFEAVQMMADKNVGALLVMAKNKLVGVISERDYTRKVVIRGKASKTTTVGEILSSPVISVTPQHTVEACMELMTTHRVRHLPVVDGEKVVGVISIGDLVNWIITVQRATIQQLQDYISGSYPG